MRSFFYGISQIIPDWKSNRGLFAYNDFLQLIRFKSVFKMADFPCVVRGRVDLHDVETARRRFSLPLAVHHVPHRPADDAALLFPSHCRRGLTVSRAPSRLYLDEHQRFSVPRDQVDFPHRRPVLPFENRVTFLFEVRGGGLFPPVAQSFPVHGMGLLRAPAFVSMR